MDRIRGQVHEPGSNREDNEKDWTEGQRREDLEMASGRGSGTSRKVAVDTEQPIRPLVPLLKDVGGEDRMEGHNREEAEARFMGHRSGVLGETEVVTEQPTLGDVQASCAGDAEDPVCVRFRDEACRAGGSSLVNHPDNADGAMSMGFRDGVNVTEGNGRAHFTHEAEDVMYARFRRGANLVEQISNALGPVAHPEPKTILPLFCGKAKWGTFWLQFQWVARRYDWDEEMVMDRLVCSLRDEALTFFYELPDYVQNNLKSATHHLSRRFDEHLPPEAYRSSLQGVRCGRKEKLEEYASRIRRLVSKAYPGCVLKLLERLTVEYFLWGLSDTDMIYEVLTKKPQTVNEAVDLIRWHTCCRSIQSQQKFNKITLSKGEEARLCHVGHEAKVSVQRAVLKGCVSRDDWIKTAECHYCHGIGHIRRNCPSRKMNRREHQ